MSDEFWLGRGLRQGCPLSPILFNLLVADLEEILKKGCWSWHWRIEEGRIFSLTYADDMVLVAEDEEGMKAMIARLERLDEKRLEVNEKTKILIFKKGGGRRKKISWRWKNKVIEEVKKMKYLGCFSKKW